MNRKISLQYPGKYRIRVLGKIDANWLDCFEDMSITTGYTQDGVLFTELEGILQDQAAVQGALQMLYTLGLALVSVQLLDKGDAQDLPP